MSSSHLERIYNSVKYYEATLKTLEQTKSPSVEQILDVLIVRDEVQVALNEKTPTPAWSLIEVQRLDNSLKQKSQLITQKIDLVQLREILQPPTSAWWWSFEHSSRWDNLDWLWSGLSVSFITISLGLVTAISSRFISGGIDALGSIAVVTQGALTLVAGRGALTQVGQKTGQNLLTHLNIPKHFWQEISCGLAFLLLVGLFNFHNSLPKIAVVYYQRGEKDYNASPPRLGSAQANFERAIKLDPDNAKARYGLGNIYEDLQNLKRARAEYEIAIQGNFSRAYNNLARLYILEKKYSTAASLLLNGLDLVNNDEQPSKVEYSLRKNLGWARLEQKRYAEAEVELQEAIQLDNEKAPAYCLLAQVLEGKGNETQKALKFWNNCKTYANPSTSPEEDTWLHLASQKLKAGGSL